MSTYSTGYQGHQKTFTAPDACPVYPHHSQYEFTGCQYVGLNKARMQSLFKCGFQDCRYYFICEFASDNLKEPLSVRPIKPNLTSFAESVTKLSPTFVSIFAEAEEAKILGLKQIAGPGYR